MLTAEFKAESTRNKMTKNGLKEPEREKMQKEALDSLHKALRTAQQDAENGEFASEFNDVCPHCGKHQSWSLKAMGTLPAAFAFLGIVFGGILCLAVDFFELAYITLFSGLIVAAAFGLIGIATGFVCIKIRKVQTQNVHEKQIPRITWPEID